MLPQTPVATSALTEKSLVDYPRNAVRELAMNAIMHRDYRSTAPIDIHWFQDRIEIKSPGGLYGEASPQNFPNRSSYRNPIIAEALKALGYVNRYGYGIQRAQEALRRNGNPPAEFTTDDPNNFLVIIRRTR